MTSRTQIVATIGPSTKDPSVIKNVIASGMDAARINMSWGSQEEDVEFIRDVRAAAKELGRKVPIIIDLSGPREQGTDGHHFSGNDAIPTQQDLADIAWGVTQNVEYFAVSYVGSASDVESMKSAVRDAGSSAKIIAKIERDEAIADADNIIQVADAVMVARGDLGNEVPLESIPYVQYSLVKKAMQAKKPVIVATEMLTSMIEHPVPTRADVTDIAFAVLMGADAVMLSNETTLGKYPVEAVTMMEKVLQEAEKHGMRRERNFL